MSEEVSHNIIYPISEKVLASLISIQDEITRLTDAVLNLHSEPLKAYIEEVSPKLKIPKNYMTTTEFVRKYGIMCSIALSKILRDNHDYFGSRCIRNPKERSSPYYFDPEAVVEFILFNVKASSKIKSLYKRMLNCNPKLRELQEKVINKRNEANAIN